jgi:hypothetical protein
MNGLQRAEFLDAMAEAENLMRLTQAALQRARSRCHAEVFVQVDVLSKRIHESKVKSGWLRYVVLGKIELEASTAGTESRDAGDRRVAIDRRVARMQSQVLSADRQESSPPRSNADGSRGHIAAAGAFSPALA